MKKAEMRTQNLAVAKDRPELNTAMLDSSLKRNTAFIKKLVRLLLRPFIVNNPGVNAGWSAVFSCCLIMIDSCYPESSYTKAVHPSGYTKHI